MFSYTSEVAGPADAREVEGGIATLQRTKKLVSGVAPLGPFAKISTRYIRPGNDIGLRRSSKPPKGSL
jgi:hypothetical protein